MVYRDRQVARAATRRETVHFGGAMTTEVAKFVMGRRRLGHDTRRKRRAGRCADTTAGWRGKGEDSRGRCAVVDDVLKGAWRRKAAGDWVMGCW